MKWQDKAAQKQSGHWQSKTTINVETQGSPGNPFSDLLKEHLFYLKGTEGPREPKGTTDDKLMKKKKTIKHTKGNTDKYGGDM